VSILALMVSAAVLAEAGGPPGPTVGFVCSRQGACVLLYAPGAVEGQELVVARPTVLISVTANKTKTTVWAKWRGVGRVRVRRLLAKNYALAHVVQETTRTPTEGQNIRPGDPVFKAKAIGVAGATH